MLVGMMIHVRATDILVLQTHLQQLVPEPDFVVPSVGALVSNPYDGLHM